MAANREKITPERIALNLQDAKIEDNSGIVATDLKIEASAPLALETDFNLKKLIEDSRIPVEQIATSLSAGAFVCNSVFYKLCFLRENKIQKFESSFCSRT